MDREPCWRSPYSFGRRPKFLNFSTVTGWSSGRTYKLSIEREIVHRPLCCAASKRKYGVRCRGRRRNFDAPIRIRRRCFAPPVLAAQASAVPVRSALDSYTWADTNNVGTRRRLHAISVWHTSRSFTFAETLPLQPLSNHTDPAGPPAGHPETLRSRSRRCHCPEVSRNVPRCFRPDTTGRVRTARGKFPDRGCA